MKQVEGQDANATAVGLRGLFEEELSTTTETNNVSMTALKLLIELTKAFNSISDETYKEKFAVPEDSKDLIARIRIVDDNAAKFFKHLERNGEDYRRLCGSYEA